MEEIVTLWKEVGEISEDRAKMKKGTKEAYRPRNHVYKGRKGFGFGVKAGKAGSGNTTIRDLLGREEYTAAAVRFLMLTKVGEVKEEVIQR